MELRRYLDLAARWWWLVILGAVLAGSSAYLVSKRITPIYRTSATVLVDQSRQATTDYNSILVSERLTQTYAEWLRKRPVLDEVVARLHGTVDAQALSGMVSVAPVRTRSS